MLDSLQCQVQSHGTRNGPVIPSDFKYLTEHPSQWKTCWATPKYYSWFTVSQTYIHLTCKHKILHSFNICQVFSELQLLYTSGKTILCSKLYQKLFMSMEKSASPWTCCHGVTWTSVIPVCSRSFSTFSASLIMSSMIVKPKDLTHWSIYILLCESFLLFLL